MTALRALGCCLVLLMLASAGTQALAQLAGPGGKPVTIDGAVQYDLTSRINARDYRLFVYMPPGLDPALDYPVLYLLDGNVYFTTGTDALGRLAGLGAVAPALLVAIGYPDADRERRRTYDLTPSQSLESEERHETGGAGLFARVIEEEIKPFIAARYHVDTGRQALFGHSYAGLFVLHMLFTQPQSFSAYIGSSPSIWYNEREVLRNEAGFAARVRAGEVKVSLLLTSAADEQEQAGAPERMVDNASELAVRLGEIDGENFRVERVIFVGEDHYSVPFAALNRALRFALPVE